MIIIIIIKRHVKAWFGIPTKLHLELDLFIVQPSYFVSIML
jgi:hypothetical protein